jgi:hypothetical protein
MGGQEVSSLNEHLFGTNFRLALRHCQSLASAHCQSTFLLTVSAVFRMVTFSVQMFV